MFDLLVIGGGPGGYEAASLAGANGLSVCLFEKTKLGGTCLNEGCIPLKYFLHISKAFKEIEVLKKQGVLVDKESIAPIQNKIVENKNQVIEDLRKGIASKLDYNHVTTVHEYASIKMITDTKVIVEANGTEYEGKRLIIATGSKERKINVKTSSDMPIIYSSDFLNLQTIPKSIVIVGAGVIGLEAASYFNDLGVKVTLVDMMKKIGGSLDSEIEKAYERIIKRKGIKLELGKSIEEIRENIVLLNDGTRIESEMCMIAVGRVANIDNIGIDNTSIVHDEKSINIDEFCKTNLENVYAIGDVTGKLMLAHTAYHQAEIAISNILGKEKKVRYDLIPQIIYSNPEITTMGLTEDICKEESVSYIAKSIPLAYSGKYYAEHGRDGAIAKFIVDPDSKKILGASIIGNTGSEIAIFLELIMKNENTIEDIKELIFPHPTMGEVIKELIEQF